MDSSSEDDEHEVGVEEETKDASTLGDVELAQLSQAFHFLGTPPRIVCDDSGAVLFVSKPISRNKVWNSFVTWTDKTRLLAKCLVCDTSCKLTGKKMWNAQMHVYRNHSHLSTYSELCANSKKWVGKVEADYARAVCLLSTPQPQAGGLKRSFQPESVTSSKIAPKLSLKRTISIGLCLGLKSLGYYENAGDKFIIDSIVSADDRKGISRRNQTRDVEVLFDEEKLLKKNELHAALEMPPHYRPPCEPNPEVDAKLIGVRLNGTQDAWSGINGRPFLGMNAFLMDARSSPWKIWQTTLTCRHFPPPHTAAALGDLMKDESELWEIPPSWWATWAQDTTGSSFNAWEDEEGGQTPCFSHVSQLFIKHSVKNSPALMASFNAVHHIATKIKSSSLRMEELVRCQKARVLKQLVVVFHVETRWNSWEKCVERGTYNFPAYAIMEVNSMFRKTEDKDAWRGAMQTMEDSIPLRAAAMPIMTAVSQWCQILTCKEVVTISLVRCAIRCFRGEVDKVKAVADGMDATESESVRQTQADLLEFYGALVDQVNKYFGDDYYNYWLYKCGEFLDPRTIFCIEEVEDFKEIIEILSELAYEEENAIPERTRVPNSAMARMAAAAAATPDNNETSLKSLFARECDAYIAHLTLMGEDEVMKIDTLLWWADVGMYKFPILSRMAMRILCAQPTSAETERVFSISGRILNEMRSRLTSSHVNQLVCLHSWLKPKYGKQDSTRDSKRLAKSSRFATLSLQLEAVAAPDDPFDQDNLEFCYI
jgi:hypothetical protein